VTCMIIFLTFNDTQRKIERQALHSAGGELKISEK
jgi:hypothetical protein